MPLWKLWMERFVVAVEVEAELGFKWNEVKWQMLSKVKIYEWGCKAFTVLKTFSMSRR